MIVLFAYFARVLRAVSVQLLIVLALLLRKNWLLLSWLGSEDAVTERSRFGIHAFIGENGSGKTNLMMRQAYRGLQRGRTVISTVPMYLDKSAGELHPLYVPFDSWKRLKHARNCIIVMDEMTGVANARDTAQLPGEIQLILNQLRKRKITVLWSSPSFEDAQVQIRRVTRAVTLCGGSWADKGAYRAAVAAADSEFDEAWIPNRLFHARTYRKAVTPDFKIQKNEAPAVEEYYWGPGSKSFELYDTEEETTRLQEADEGGQCMDCLGARRRDECVCESYVTKKKRRDSTRKSIADRPAHVHVHAGEPALVGVLDDPLRPPDYVNGDGRGYGVSGAEG